MKPIINETPVTLTMKTEDSMADRLSKKPNSPYEKHISISPNNSFSKRASGGWGKLKDELEVKKEEKYREMATSPSNRLRVYKDERMVSIRESKQIRFDN